MPPNVLPPVVPTVPDEQPPGLPVKTPVVRKKLLFMLGGLLAALFIILIAAGVWYQLQLRPVDATTTTKQRVTIQTGTSLGGIAQLLTQKKLIRSSIAFDVYIRLHGLRPRLQAGVYSLAPSESTADIVAHLVGGKTDDFTITFYPGATLTDNSSTPDSKKVDVTHVLLRAGYSKEEIAAALAKTYDSPLFADKPAGTTLEGYIYGETYQFQSGASVEEILTRTFAEFYGQLQKYHIIEGMQAQGLSLYQGITLASIIQREVSNPADQRQVAQIFYLRLHQNMPLGSDVTAYYGADSIGAPRSVNVDTLYNTRLHAGLPPGPIAVPGLGALQAVAQPAPGDYLYFLSGDDGKTYYAHTNEEHEQNIINHCQVKCSGA